MATLESQYWKFLEENPGSTLTFEEWKQKWADDMKPIFEKLNNPPIEWNLYQRYADSFIGYEDIPSFEWFKHELEHNEEFREKYGDKDSIYCPVCSGCGEDGCCKATMCKMTPDGSYCETYLKDLKVAYKMDEWVTMELYKTFTEEQRKQYDEAYEQILDEVYGKN